MLGGVQGLGGLAGALNGMSSLAGQVAGITDFAQQQINGALGAVGSQISSQLGQALNNFSIPGVGIPGLGSLGELSEMASQVSGIAGFAEQQLNQAIGGAIGGLTGQVGDALGGAVGGIAGQVGGALGGLNMPGMVNQALQQAGGALAGQIGDKFGGLMDQLQSGAAGQVLDGIDQIDALLAGGGLTAEERDFFSQIKSQIDTKGVFGGDNGVLLAGGEIFDEGQGLIAGRDGESSMLTMHDGWNSDYMGYRNTPLLFDPSGGAPIRQYPKFDRNFRQVVQLNADDEIVKSSLPVFVSKEVISGGFTLDEKSLNRYLGLSGTIRGIGILTLSYLDKTVAAGLSTVQQQADQAVTHELLKQISWTSSKLANPQREQLYSDVDEKFEACMLAYQVEQSGAEMTRDIKLGALGYLEEGDKNVNLLCPECEELIGATNQYAYCVCCAERAPLVNTSTTFEKDGEELERWPRWSLAERLIAGSRMILKEEGAGGRQTEEDKTKFVAQFISYYQNIYGDVVFQNRPAEMEGGGGIVPSPTVVSTYLPPAYDVVDYIAQMRNNHLCQENGCSGEVCTVGTEILSCPFSVYELSWGICPALRCLIDSSYCKNLEGYPEDGPFYPFTQEDTVNRAALQLWAEASLGMPLSARDIDILRQRNLLDSRRKERWINAFCDASAVAAFRRLHNRMKSVVRNHATLNQSVSERDKAIALRLLDRIDRQLSGAESDVNAGGRAEVMLAALNVQYERLAIAEQSTAQAALEAHHMMSQRLNDIHHFGWGTSHVFGLIGDHDYGSKHQGDRLGQGSQ